MPQRHEDTKYFRVRQKEAPVVQWLLYFLVKSDTNNDKKLDYKDKRTLAVTDAGGRGYTEIISDVEEVFGQAMPDPNTLLVIYRADSKKQVAKIDLPRRKLVSATELPTLGYDVQ